MILLSWDHVNAGVALRMFFLLASAAAMQRSSCVVLCRAVL
jgi:hypothetical protein